jgi:hypothetical protein
MQPALSPSPIDLLPNSPADRDEELRLQVWGLLSVLYPPHGLWERRRGQRFPFPHLITLTPVGNDSATPVGESLVVAGKQISEDGIGFYHEKPLPHRRMIASVDAGNGHRLGFLIDITWCRFTRQRWYESGGRLVQTVGVPPGV